MAGYIQIAIGKIKAVDVEQMRALRKRGHRTIRFRLEKAEGTKRPATASVPLSWIVDARDRWEAGGRRDDSVFNGFVSDWVSGWVK